MTDIDTRFNQLCDTLEQISGHDIRCCLDSRIRETVILRDMVEKQLFTDGFTYVAIGRMLNKKHSSIIHGVKHIESLIQYPMITDQIYIKIWDDFQKQITT